MVAPGCNHISLMVAPERLHVLMAGCGCCGCVLLLQTIAPMASRVLDHSTPEAAGFYEW